MDCMQTMVLQLRVYALICAQRCFAWSENKIFIKFPQKGQEVSFMRDKTAYDTKLFGIGLVLDMLIYSDIVF